MTITPIDSTTIACGERNSKVTLLDISDRANIKSLGKFGFKNLVVTCTPIDSTTIACGGGDKKVTLLDISDRANIKSLGDFNLNILY